MTATATDLFAGLLADTELAAKATSIAAECFAFASVPSRSRHLQWQTGAPSPCLSIYGNGFRFTLSAKDRTLGPSGWRTIEVIVIRDGAGYRAQCRRSFGPQAWQRSDWSTGDLSPRSLVGGAL